MIRWCSCLCNLHQLPNDIQSSRRQLTAVVRFCWRPSPNALRYGIYATGGHPFLRMYLWWSLCTLYLHACQVRVTVGNSGLCCGTYVTYFACFIWFRGQGACQPIFVVTVLSFLRVTKNKLFCVRCCCCCCVLFVCCFLGCVCLCVGFCLFVLFVVVDVVLAPPANLLVTKQKHRAFSSHQNRRRQG